MTTAAEETEVIEATSGAETNEDAVWLQRAQKLHANSTDYYESSLFPNWSDNVRNFRNEHASGSKYTSDAYKHRSKIFRPKTRSAMRNLDATAAAALFTNDDLIAIRGIDKNNKQQEASAKIHQAILQHRLEVSIPWFLTVIGAYQDTNVYGVCISRQFWDYRVAKKTRIEREFDEDGKPVKDEDGLPLGSEVITEKVLADKPAIDLLAPENFRFDPACDWRDPVGTSPYLIEIIPMYAGEVMAMMEQGEWNEHTIGSVIAHGTQEQDASQSVRSARESGREDSTEVNSSDEYAVVWARFNIIRDEEGIDYGFYTMGSGLLLTDPVPLEDFEPLGRDRYRVGISEIETHRAHPASKIELARPLTEMSNDVTNQRLDNVKLVLNKRYAIRKNSGIDLAALMRNVPGGGVIMDDVNNDFKIMDTPDVTQSSYVEQDRLSVETDELLGTFSQASVQSNRSLNETVGGMNLMASGANQVQELGLRTFIETWVEPVLRTLIKLESLYETDEIVLALAAGDAEMFDQIDDDLMMQDLVVKVNVGMGNTDPQQKLKRFLEPLSIVKDFPEFIEKIDFLEVGKEVFALSGQGDGSRFMLTDEKIQERKEAQGEGPEDPRIVVEQMRSEIKQMEMEIRQLEAEQDGILRQMKIESDKEVAMAKIASDQKTTLTALYENLGIKRETEERKSQLEQARIQTQRDIAAIKSKYDNLNTLMRAKNVQRGFDSF